ncbi:MAG: hypothetical protein AAB579_01020 [Patescibacteria group bacterium]
MSPLAPLLSFIMGLMGVAYVGAQVMTAPPPPPPTQYGGEYSVPAQTCPELTAQCSFGYAYDKATGCSSNECAPDPAIQQQEWDAQCVKDKQRELKDFERNSIKDTERRFKELEKNKFVVPAEAKANFEQMKAAWQKAQGLVNCQDLNDATKDMYDFSNEVNGGLRDAEDVMNNARCIKDAQRELKDFERYAIKDPEQKILRAKKQKVAIPSNITDGIARLKELMALKSY